MAQLVGMWMDLGAKVIAFDVVFAEPDRTALASIAQSLPSGEVYDPVKSALQELPDNDVIFAKAIVSFLPIMLGILIVLNGLMQLSNASGGIKEVNPRYRISIYVYCGLLVAAGILLIFNPFKTVLVVFRIFGGILVFMGISELAHFFLQKKVN